MSEQEDWEVADARDDRLPEQRFSQLCIWALILGILSPVCCGCFTGIPAVITGHMGLSRVGDESGDLKGRGFAIAGLVLGYISIIGTVAYMLFVMLTGGFEEIMRELDR